MASGVTRRRGPHGPAETGRRSGFGHLKQIFMMAANTSRAIRLYRSTEVYVEDSSLESLLHRVVFEFRTMASSVERAEHIGSKIDSLLPANHNTVNRYCWRRSFRDGHNSGGQLCGADLPAGRPAGILYSTVLKSLRYASTVPVMWLRVTEPCEF